MLANNKMVGHLGEKVSGGQRQIINIINGMIGDAKVVILDEPTNALDPELKKELILYIQSYKSRKNAIIIITHDKEVIPILDKIITP
jgi:ABC-type bacteriocin/lantibiotic exporter with double-glycine peptidase domain